MRNTVGALGTGIALVAIAAVGLFGGDARADFSDGCGKPDCIDGGTVVGSDAPAVESGIDIPRDPAQTTLTTADVPGGRGGAGVTSGPADAPVAEVTGLPSTGTGSTAAQHGTIEVPVDDLFGRIDTYLHLVNFYAGRDAKAEAAAASAAMALANLAVDAAPTDGVLGALYDRGFRPLEDGSWGLTV
jgi:hypothetical protein